MKYFNTAGPCLKAPYAVSTARYLDRLGLDHGTLVVFDLRDASVAPAARIEFAQERTPSDHPVRLLRA